MGSKQAGGAAFEEPARASGTTEPGPITDSPLGPPHLLAPPGTEDLPPYAFEDDDENFDDVGESGSSSTTGPEPPHDSPGESRSRGLVLLGILAGTVALVGIVLVATIVRGDCNATTTATSSPSVVTPAPGPPVSTVETRSPSTSVASIDPEMLFLDRLESSGAATELARMIAPAQGEKPDDAYLALGAEVCSELADGTSLVSVEDQIMQAIMQENGIDGPSAPGARGRAAIADLVNGANQYLCPEVVAPVESPTTSARPTTTTPASSTTAAQRFVEGVVRNRCRDVPCKVYLRADPNGDLSRASDSYYLDGDDVVIACRTTAQNVRDDDTGRTSSTWYLTDDGFYIAGLFVEIVDTPATC